MTALFWLLSVFGLTWILTRSVIFAWLRALFPKPTGTTPFFGVLLRCPQCMGFWVGVLHALVMAPAPFGSAPRALGILLSGFAASGFSYAMMLVCEKLGQKPLDE